MLSILPFCFFSFGCKLTSDYHVINSNYTDITGDDAHLCNSSLPPKIPESPIIQRRTFTSEGITIGQLYPKTPHFQLVGKKPYGMIHADFEYKFQLVKNSKFTVDFAICMSQNLVANAEAPQLKSKQVNESQWSFQKWKVSSNESCWLCIAAKSKNKTQIQPWIGNQEVDAIFSLISPSHGCFQIKTQLISTVSKQNFEEQKIYTYCVYPKILKEKYSFVTRNGKLRQLRNTRKGRKGRISVINRSSRRKSMKNQRKSRKQIRRQRRLLRKVGKIADENITVNLDLGMDLNKNVTGVSVTLEDAVENLNNETLLDHELEDKLENWIIHEKTSGNYTSEVGDGSGDEYSVYDNGDDYNNNIVPNDDEEMYDYEDIFEDIEGTYEKVVKDLEHNIRQSIAGTNDILQNESNISALIDESFNNELNDHDYGRTDDEYDNDNEGNDIPEDDEVPDYDNDENIDKVIEDDELSKKLNTTTDTITDSIINDDSSKSNINLTNENEENATFNTKNILARKWRKRRLNKLKRKQNRFHNGTRPTRQQRVKIKRQNHGLRMCCRHGIDQQNYLRTSGNNACDAADEGLLIWANIKYLMKKESCTQTVVKCCNYKRYNRIINRRKWKKLMEEVKMESKSQE